MKRLTLTLLFLLPLLMLAGAQAPMQYAPFMVKQTWSPSVLSPVLWFDPSELANSNGDLIARLPDKSGNGWDAYQSTDANKPYYTNSSIFAKPTLRFTGSPRILTVSNAANNVARNIGGLTIAAVVAEVSSVGVTSDKTIIQFDRNVSGSTRASALVVAAQPNGPGVGRRRLDADTFAYVQTTVLLPNYSKTRMVWVFDYANATYTTWTNGVVAAYGSTGTSGNTSDTASSTVTVGAYTGGGYFGGLIGELFVIKSACTTNQCLSIDSYLNSRW